MLRDFTIKAFPPITSDFIDLPNIAELMIQPIWLRADADIIRKHGSELQKWLLDKAPLTNKRKYVHVSFNVSLLYPGVINVPNKYWKGLEGEWHRDGNSKLFVEHPDVCHILQTDCECLTEFNEHERIVPIPENWTQEELIVMLNMNPASFGVTGKKIPPNHYVSFTDHFHRVIDPTHHQLRFFVRIIESNSYLPEPYPDCQRKNMTVGKAGEPNSGIVNIENYLGEGRLVFHYKVK